MKKNINIRELERWLKSSLKNKVSIDNRSVIAYLMMGFAGLMMSTIANAGWINPWGQINYWQKTSGNADAFTFGWNAEKDVTGEGSVMIAKGDKINQKLQNSVVIGYGGGVPNGSGINAETQRLKIDVENGGHGIVAIGSVRVLSNPHGIGSTGNGGQGVAIGNDVTSTSQAVAIGNNTYALGNASIAVGSDDISTYRDKITNYDYKNYLQPLYNNIDSSHTSYGIGNGAANDIYSPNVAGGTGSIAIGSRTMAYKDGSTALGTLAYALGKGATALGTQSRAEGEGSIAVGNKTRNFANQALAIGNDSQILNVGGTAVGLRARSGGEGSIAIGTDVYANVIMNTDPIIKSKLVDREMGTNSTTITNVENTVKDDKAINPELTKFHDIEGIIKTTANQKNAIVIGTRSVATGDNAMALGRGAFAMANNAFGIGSYSYADHVNAMAIGTSSRALAENSITVGAGSVATAAAKNATVLGTNSGVGGENSSVVGSNSEAFSKNTLIYGNETKIGALNSTNNTDNNVAIGNKVSIGSGVTNSMAYGPNTRIGDTDRTKNSNIDSSTAFGSGATIERLYNGLTAGRMTNAQAKAAADANNQFMYTGNNAMAIGNYSRAVLENSVALGVRSETDYTYSDLLQPGWTARGSIAVPTSGQTGVISVGSKGQERRIVNVASGYRDTDAVNVIQLRTLEETVTNKVDSIESGMHYLSVNKEGDDFNGEKGSKKVTQLIEREKNFNQYVRYRIQQIQLEARQKWQGEKFNEESLREIDKKVTELGTDTEITRVASALATKTISPIVPAGKSPAEAYRDLVNDLETIRYDLVEKDRTDLTKIDGKYQKGKYNELLAGEDIAALKRVTNYSNEGGQGDDSLAVGFRALAVKDESNATNKINAARAIAMGYKSKTSAKESISIGDESNVAAAADRGIAVGYKAQAEGARSLSLGSKSKAQGELSIAIGSNEHSKDGTTASGKQSIAFGNAAKATAEKAMAMGAEAEATAKNAVALGASAKATLENSVAIGQGTETKASTGKSYLTDRTFSDTGKVVSVGNRRINQLEDGANDDDAVTVRQLKKVAPILEAQNSGSGITNNKIATNPGATIKVQADSWGSGDSRYDGSNLSTYIGGSADAPVVSIGLKENPKFKTLTLNNGTGKSKDLSFTTDKDGNLNLATSNTANTKAKITNLADGTADSDAATVGQLKGQLKGATPTLVGDLSTERHNWPKITPNATITVTGGTFNEDNNNEEKFYSGSNLKTLVNGTESAPRIEIGIKKVPTFRAIKLNNEEAGAQTLTLRSDKDGNLNVGSKRITGVSNATGDNDAVNYSQLKGVSPSLKAENAGTGIANNTLKTNNGSTIEFKSGDFSGAGSVRYVGENLSTHIVGTADAPVVTVGLRKDPTFETLKLNNGTRTLTLSTDNSGNLNVGNKKITGVADGTISATSTDAINGKQLNTVKTTADTAKNTADTAKATADTAKNTADTAKATADTAKNTADTAKTTADTAKNTADTAKTTADDVANKLTTLGDKTLSFSANSGTAVAKKLGESIGIEGDDTTISTKAGNNKITIEVKDGGISTAKLADKAVTSTKLADGAVGTTQLGNKAVTTAKLADGAVTTTQLGNNAVTTTKLNDGAVTEAKLDNGLLNKINAGNTVATNKIRLAGDKDTTGAATKTTEVALNNNGGIEFAINGKDGLETKASGTTVEVGLSSTLKTKLAKLDNLDDNANNKYATKDETANKDLGNVTTNGKNVIKDAAREAVVVEAGTNITVTTNKDDTNHKTTYTVALDKDTTDKINNIGKVSDGKDGKDAKPGAAGTPGAAGAAGTHGLTGKDGLNGKDLTTKVNALRNGEAGTVVFTDAQGNRLVKANNGGYYKTNQVDENGDVITPTGGATPTAVAENDIELRVVTSKGETATTSIKLSNIANGKIDANSKDAINGSQLKAVADKLGLTVGADGKTLILPTITGLKDATGTAGTNPTSVVDGLNAVIGKVNEGIKYKGDLGTAETQQLGTTFNVNKAGSTITDGTGTTATNYVGSNLITRYTKNTDGSGKLEIGFKESPTFKDVTADSLKTTGNITAGGTITGKDGKFENLKVTEKIITKEIEFKDGSGNNLTLVNGKDGNLYINGVAVPSAANAPVIYTNEAGNRVELGQDGKVYEPKDLKGLTYVKARPASGTVGTANYKPAITGGYYADDQFEKENGTFKKDEEGNKILITGATSKDLTDKEYKGTVIHKLSAIKPGDTTARILRNVADGVGNNDAVNMKQFKTVSENTIKLTTDGTTGNETTALRLDKTGGISFGIKGANGIETSANGTDVTVKLKDDYKNKLDNLADNADTKYATKTDVDNKANKNADNLTTTDVTAWKTKLGLSTAVLGNVSLGLEAANKETDTSTTETAAGTGSVNLTAGDKLKVTGIDDVVVKVSNKEITVGLKKDTVDKINNIGKVSDGKDGKDAKPGAAGTAGAAGAAGTHGLTGKDGLNGKDLTTKVNALRNGEAGTVVFTDKDGNRLVKANDGGYYKTDQVNENGDVITPTGGTRPTAVAEENIELRVVDSKGETKNNTATAKGIKLSNIADGKIDANSKDAINGSQIKNVLEKIGVTTDANGNVEAPTITKIKDDKGDDTTVTAPTTLKDGLNAVIDKVNKGIKYKGDLGNEGTQQLGTVFNVNRAGSTLTETVGTNTINYVGSNLITNYTKNADGSGKLEIGFKESPTFKDVTATGNITGKDGKFENLKVTEKIITKEIEFKDGSGNNLTLVTGKDGNLYINGVAVPTAESAPVIYTNTAGERVEKGQDGKIYKPEDIKNLTYVKARAASGTAGTADYKPAITGGYYADSQFEVENGVIKKDSEGNKVLKASATPENLTSKEYKDEVLHKLSPLAGTDAKRLTNVADGKNNNDAVNMKQLNAVKETPIKFVGDDNQEVDRKLGQTLKINGDGIKVSKNAAGDGLVLSIAKGKVETINVADKAITSAKLAEDARTVVYVDSNNNVIELGADGKLHKATDLKGKTYVVVKDTTGNVDQDKTGFYNDADLNADKTAPADNTKTPVTVADVNPATTKLRHALNGYVAGGTDVTTKSVLTNVGAGKIDANSTDAINGSQLKAVADKVGLTVDATNNTLSLPAITALKDATGNNTTAPTTLVGGLNDVIGKVNEGLSYKGDLGTQGTQQLGSTFEVVKATNELKKAGETQKISKIQQPAAGAPAGTLPTVVEETIDKKYVGSNLITNYTKDANGNGKLEIGFADSPVFNHVKANTVTTNTIVFEDGTGKKLSLGPTADGKLQVGGKEISTELILSKDGTTADGKVDLAKDKLHVASGNNVTVEIANNKITVGLDDATKDKLANLDANANTKYANKDASNITGKDLAAWKTTLGINNVVSGTGNLSIDAATLGTETGATETANGKATVKLDGTENFKLLGTDGITVKGATTGTNKTLTFGLDDTTKAAIKNIGKSVSDGRDGKDATNGTNGANGTNGLTAKDGLNGKDLTTKVNALRNGEAGTVVFTDKDGNRLVKANDGYYYDKSKVKEDGSLLNPADAIKKANDGKYYAADKVDTTGTLIDPNATPVAYNPELRVVNEDGSTTEPNKLSNIADGKIAIGSKDAINGSQIKNVLDKIGVTTDADGNVVAPTITAIKGKDGTNGTASTSVVDGLNKVIETVNSGISYAGDSGTGTQQLGSTFNVNRAGRTTVAGETALIETVGANTINYVGDNVITKYTKDTATGNGKLEIGFKESPTFKNVTAENIDAINGKLKDLKVTDKITTKEIVFDSGTGTKLTLVTGKDGNLYINGVAVPTAENAPVTYTNTTGERIELGQDGNLYKPADIKDLTYVPADAAKGIQAGYYEDNQFEKLADGSFKQDEHGNKVLNGPQTPKDLTTKAYTGEVLHSLSPINKNRPSTNGYRLVHVADGKDDTDAVNMKQLKEVKDSTITFKGDTAADTVSRKLGETLNITGNGIKVTKNKAGDGLELSISKGKVDTVNVKDKAVTSAKLAEDARTVVYVTPDNKAVELGADGKLHKAEDLAGKTYVVVKNATGAVDNTKTGYYADADVNEDGELKNPATATKLADPEEVNPTATKLRHALNGYVAGGTDVTTKSILTNVGEGTISATSTDAINGAQFHKLSTNTIRLTADGVTTGGTTTNDKTDAKELNTANGISFGIKGADGITTTANGTDVTVKLDATTKAKLDNLDANANDKYAKKDATNMTGLTDAEKAKWREAIGLEHAVTGTGKLAIDTAIKGTGTGATEQNKGTAEVKLDGTEKFKMIGTGGVTVEATGKEITFGLDKDTTDKLKNITAVADGKDGKATNGTDGSNGSHGLTGKDGLNGKDLTTKVNALRNGEAGTVVFTDAQGNRLVKANDGKYYLANQVNENGGVITPTGGTTPTAVAEADIELRVVNSKGETAATSIKLSNIADGKIGAGSKDAINGSQIKDVLDKLGVEIDNTTGAIKQPTITAIKGADGKDGAATTSVVAGLNKVIETVNSGIKYNGDLGTEATQQLGSTFSVVRAEKSTVAGYTPLTETVGANTINYVGDNLITKYTLDNTTGNGKLEIGLKESPTFKDVTADNLKANTKVEAPKVVIKGEAGADGTAGKDAVLTADNNGNLKVGDKIITAGAIELGLTGKTVKADGTATTVGGATDKVNLSTGEKLEVVGKDGVTVNIAGKSVTLGLDKDTTDKLKNITAVSDGKDGKATNGTDGSNGSHGLTGKDGLNGKDLTTKVNALRNGEAGTVVFTDKDGNRLVKANDGKYYLPTQVDDKGNVITTGGTTPTAVDNPELRVVNANGETTKPTALNNLASGLGLTNTTGATPTAITANNAKTTVNNLLTKTDGLNKAVNVGDLQALAQAGLNFTGNSGNAHAPLSTTVNVAGQGTPATGFVGASGNINVVASEDTTTANKIAKLEIQLAEALKGIKSIQNGDTKITLDKDNGVKVDGKDGGKVVVNGKDGKDGVTITGTNGTNGSSIVVNGKDGAAGKDSVTIKGGDGTNGSSIAVNGKDGKDGVTIKGTNGTDGSSIAVNGKDGKDGVTIKGTNGTDGSSIVVNGKDGKDGVTIKGTNGTDGSSIAVNGKDGKDGVTIKGGDGTNGATITFDKKTDAHGNTTGTGSITGLKDPEIDPITNKPKDPTAATTVNYVTNQIEGAKTEIRNEITNLVDGGMTYKGNSGDDVKVELKGTLNIKGEGNYTGTGSASGNIAVVGDLANKTLEIKLNKDLKNIETISNGDTKITLDKDNGVKVDGTDGGKVVVNGKDGKDGVTIKGTNGTDGSSIAVNGKDGKDGVTIKGTNGTDGSSIAVNGKDGKDGVTIKGTNGTDGSSIAVNGKDGKDGVTIKGTNGTDGSSIAVNGKDGKDGVTIKGTNGTDGSSIAVNGKDGKDGVTITGTNGTNGSSIVVNGKDGQPGVTINGGNGTNGKDATITFTKDGANGTGSITGLKDPELNPDGTPKDPTAATTVNYVTNQITNVTNKINDVANKMDKGLNFVGNSGGTVNAKLDGTVSIKGEGTIATGIGTAANNITVEKDTTAGSTGLVVKLADKLTGMTGFETKEEDGKKVTINKDGISLTTTGTPGANLKLGTDGTITGVVAKPDDKTSVATVGYVDSKIGSGITFGGDKGNNQAQELGTTLKVKAATETITANAKDYQGNQITYKAQDGTDKNVTANYRGNNLITSYNYDTANKTGTISVAMSERPEFAAVTVGKGDTKATLDGEKGSLEFNKTIEKGKDGQPIVYANNDGKIVKYKDEDGNLQPIYKQIGKGTISGLKDVDYLEVDGNRVAIDRTQAVNAGYVDDQLVDVRTRINNNTTRITELSTESRAGIAGVAAMANIPQINDAGSNKYNISVGIGKHRGETAYALGISGVSDSGRVVYKASAALDSQNKVTAGIGLGYQFGKRDIEPSELDRFKAQMTLLQADSTKKFEKLEREQQRMREEQEAIKANQYRMQEAIVAIDKKTDNIDKLNQMKMNQLEERINQKVDKIDSLNQLKINQINKEMEKVKNKLKIYK